MNEGSQYVRPLLDEEQSANLVEELTIVLLKPSEKVAHDRESKSTGSMRLTTEEAANYIGMVPYTLGTWRVCKDERCPKYIKLGHKAVYLRKHLDEWLAAWSVDNSRPLNSPHRFKRKLDLIPWEEAQATYIRKMEEPERTDSDNPSVRWELWDWRRRRLEAE